MRLNCAIENLQLRHYEKPELSIQKSFIGECFSMIRNTETLFPNSFP